MNVVSPAKKQNEVVVAKNEAKETKKAPVNKAIRAINKKPALPDNKEGNNELVTAQLDPLPATTGDTCTRRYCYQAATQHLNINSQLH